MGSPVAWHGTLFPQVSYTPANPNPALLGSHFFLTLLHCHFCLFIQDFSVKLILVLSVPYSFRLDLVFPSSMPYNFYLLNKLSYGANYILSLRTTTVSCSFEIPLSIWQNVLHALDIQYLCGELN